MSRAIPLASSQLRLSTGWRTTQAACSPVLPGQKSTPYVMCQCRLTLAADRTGACRGVQGLCNYVGSTCESSRNPLEARGRRAHRGLGRRPRGRARLGRDRRVKPVILDCDPGHDDMVAIMLAAANPELELLG